MIVPIVLIDPVALHIPPCKKVGVVWGGYIQSHQVNRANRDNGRTDWKLMQGDGRLLWLTY